MEYSIRITPRAERDLNEIYNSVHAEESETARTWYKGLRAAIRHLKSLPNRCPITPESDQLRHLLYGRKPHIYRVIFHVRKRRMEVNVLHVRHGARLPFTGIGPGSKSPRPSTDKTN